MSVVPAAPVEPLPLTISTPLADGQVQVTLPVSPAAAAALAGLAKVGAYDRIGSAFEAALAAAAEGELADLRDRTDTLQAVLQAAGPSPAAVPPTDPPPAHRSSPRTLTALPGGSGPAPDAELAPAVKPPPARRPTAAVPQHNGTRRAPIRDRLIAALADATEPLFTRELQALIGASQPRTSKILRDLVAEEIVERVGNGLPYRFRLLSTKYSATSPPPGAGERSSVLTPRQGAAARRAQPVLSDPGGPTLDGRVLSQIIAGMDTVPRLADRLSESPDAIYGALNRLREEGEITFAGGSIRPVP